MLSLRKPHKSCHRLIPLCLPLQGSGFLEEDIRAAVLTLSLSRFLWAVPAGTCMISPELGSSGKGQMGFPSHPQTCVCCQTMTKPPLWPLGLVTVESCLSDTNCHPKVIRQDQESDGECLCHHLCLFSGRHREVWARAQIEPCGSSQGRGLVPEKHDSFSERVMD